MTSQGFGGPPPITDEERERIDQQMDDAATRRAETERRREVLKHPVFKAVRDAGSGSVPTAAELAKLDLSPTDRQKVDAALTEIAETRASQDFQRAGDIAFDHAVKIVDKLPANQQQADYLEVEEIDERGPRELAEAVRSW